MTPDDNDSCYRGETAETLAWRVAEFEQENARLKQENQQLHAILKSAPVHVFTVTPEYQISYLNHRRADCLEEPVGMFLRDFMPDDQADIVESIIDQVQSDGQTQSLAVRSKITNLIQQAIYAPLKGNKDDDPARVVGVTFDITEDQNRIRQLQESKNEMEAALVESDERFRIMAETNPVPVVISDLETGSILFGNQALAETFATPFETLTDHVTSQFYADPAQRTALLQRMATGQPIRGRTMKLKDAKGKTVWVAVYLDKITFQSRPALLGCFLDIGARKQREEEIFRDRRALRRLLDTNESDRHLIAYEIHDGVVQDMTGALMFLQSGLSLVDSQSDGRYALIHGTDLLANAIQELRRLLNGLRPLSLEQGGVVAAIEDLVSRMTEEGFHVDFNHQIEFDRIAPSLEMAIYRTVQEGTNNARRHSGANSATVEIQQEGTKIGIKIRDEGSGFDPESIDPRRYGVSGIYERARLLGGKAVIDTSLGGGTTIEVILPLEDYLDSD
ncbi:PAS domain S-box protein [bacterium]|nr:PAS domain S-box protein [bacterium]